MVHKKLIESLLAIEQTGSFTKAAEMLYTTQSSLSRSVIALEKELGVQLFNRQVFPIRPTYFGKLYLKSCRETLAINNATESIIRETLAGRQGQINLGLSRYLSRCFFHLIVQEFAKTAPNVKLVLLEGSAPSLEDKLLSGEIDVALVSGKRNEPRLEYIPVIDERIVLFVTPSFAKKYGLSKGLNELPCSAKELEHYPFVLLRPGHGLRKYAESFFEEAGIRPNIVYETEEIDVSINLTSSDVGFSFAPSLTIALSKMSSSEYYYCSLKSFRQMRPVSICRNRDLYHLKAEDELIRIIYGIVQNVYRQGGCS